MKRKAGILLIVMLILFSAVGCVTQATTQGGNDYNFYIDTKLDGYNIKNAPREVINAGGEKVAIVDIGSDWKLVVSIDSITRSDYWFTISPGGVYGASQYIASQVDMEDVKPIVDRNGVLGLLVKTKRKGGN